MKNRDFFNHLNVELSFLVLDFNRPQETYWCLTSIREKVKFAKYQIILLSNGGNQDYIWDFYQRGLIDIVILNKKNEGSGFAEIRMADFCNSRYMFQMHNDNVLLRDIEQKEFDSMKETLEKPHVGIIEYTHLKPLSTRAFMMKTENYCNNHLLAGGGSGLYIHLKLKGNESAVYEWLLETKNEIISWNPFLVGDTGKYAIAEFPDGGIIKRRCDTHQIWILKPFKENPGTGIFGINESEWQQIIDGKWRGGTTPQDAVKQMFFFFSKEIDPLDD